MKIQFPNPDDFLHREDAFFDQLELCVFHAKKAWIKIKNQEFYKKDPENNYPCLSFGHEEFIENAIGEIKGSDGSRIDPDRMRLQDISIVINEL